tara:strand:+ start:623 stop:994 length:372 start_codon:yes stop_codon:yes gene_type:complete
MVIPDNIMTAFVVSPIKRVRSCPILYMSEPISPNTIKKEVVVGALMAGATMLLTGQHHHLTTFKELENTISYETINIFTNMQYDKISLYNRVIRLKKNKAFLMLVLIPFVIRMSVFSGLEFMF